MISAKIKVIGQKEGYCPQDGVKARISSIQSVPLCCEQATLKEEQTMENTWPFIRY